MKSSEQRSKILIYGSITLLVLIVVLGGVRIFQRLGVLPEFWSRGENRMAAPRGDPHPGNQD